MYNSPRYSNACITLSIGIPRSKRGLPTVVHSCQAVSQNPDRVATPSTLCRCGTWHLRGNSEAGTRNVLVASMPGTEPRSVLFREDIPSCTCMTAQTCLPRGGATSTNRITSWQNIKRESCPGGRFDLLVIASGRHVSVHVATPVMSRVVPSPFASVVDSCGCSQQEMSFEFQG